MREETAFLQDGDTAVYLYHWVPESGEVRGVLQILHGMGEHAARYARFARLLCQDGWAVVAHDQRGHGQTAHSVRDLGFYGEPDGWGKVLDDARAVTLEARRRHPGVPVLQLGHSMGSYVLQALLFRHDDVDGAIFSGSTLNTGVMVSLGRQLARIEKLRVGARKPSWLLTRLSFGAFARTIQDRRTDFDWLSHDPAEVDAYIADPLCGFPFTTGGWLDLLLAFKDLERPDNVAKIRADLPIKIASGAEDPVHEGGAGFERLSALYKARGFADLEVTLWPGMRHEILNEVDRDAVMDDFATWMNRVAGAAAAPA